MTWLECQSEYERLFRWRARWMNLSKKQESGRLQTRQDAIERRASIANNRIKALMQAYDAQVEDNMVKQQHGLSTHAERRIAILSNIAANLAEADDLLKSLDLADKNNIGLHVCEAVKATAELAYRVSESERDTTDSGRIVER